MDDVSSAVRRSTGILNVSGFSGTLLSNGTDVLRQPAADELDGVAKRLPRGDHATERWEWIVFLVLGLAGISAVGLAVFGVF